MSTENANILPATTGFDLGSPSQRWDGFIQNLDISGTVTGFNQNYSGVTFSTTPTFVALGGIQAFKIILTDNVTSASLSVPSTALPGSRFTFIIQQDSTGGWTWIWPTNMRGTTTVMTLANSITVQTFIWDGTMALAESPGVSM